MVKFSLLTAKACKLAIICRLAILCHSNKSHSTEGLAPMVFITLLTFPSLLCKCLIMIIYCGRLWSMSQVGYKNNNYVLNPQLLYMTALGIEYIQKVEVCGCGAKPHLPILIHISHAYNYRYTIHLIIIITCIMCVS